MSERDERIKNLLMLRDFLKRKMERLEKELISLRRMMESLDEVLLEQTLVTADKLKRAGNHIEARFEERGFYSEEGKLLGNLRISRDRLEVSFLPEEGVTISTKERPIKFLFRKMEELNSRIEVEEDHEGTLKSIKVRLKDPKDLDRALGFMRWALSRSVSR